MYGQIDHWELVVHLFSYVVTDDTGFAPNPFHGYLTLACCKPGIRLSAEQGDLVVGLSPKRQGNRIVFMARVDEKLPFDNYWNDPRFHLKRPCTPGSPIIRKCGDNIYEPLGNGEYKQLPSQHSSGSQENEINKWHDLGGRFVLVSKDFIYFGRLAEELEKRFSRLSVGRNYRCRFPEDFVREFDDYFRNIRTRGVSGVIGPPRRWSDNDNSWKPGS